MHFPIDTKSTPSLARRFDLAVIPLINVVFLLLVYFVVAGRMEPPRLVEVELPSSKAAADTDTESVEKPTSMEIILTPDKLAMIGEEMIDIGSFDEWVKKHSKETGTMPVTLRADATLNAMSLLDVLATLQSYGYEDVALQTKYE